MLVQIEAYLENKIQKIIKEINELIDRVGILEDSGKQLHATQLDQKVTHKYTQLNLLEERKLRSVIVHN